MKDAAKMIGGLPSEATGNWDIVHEERLRGYSTPYLLPGEAVEEAEKREGIAAEACIVQV